MLFLHVYDIDPRIFLYNGLDSFHNSILYGP